MEFLLKNVEAIDNIVQSIIRPVKGLYQLSDLGPTKHVVNGIPVQRVDLNILNQNNEMLVCSLTFPRVNEHKVRSCCIYLHGNAGSQMEAQPYLSALVKENIALFSFDMSGSGRSEGKYIHLGMKEQNDLDCVIKFLDEMFDFQDYFLWGRSMGAVTGLLYQSNHKQHQLRSLKISAMVLDSPFECFKQMCIDNGIKKTNFLSLIQDPILNVMKSKLLTSLGGIDLFQIHLRDKVKTISTPAIYLYSDEDTLVQSKHSKLLIQNHSASLGHKKVHKYVFTGHHNTFRDNNLINAGVQFLLSCQKTRVPSSLMNSIIQEKVKEVKQTPNSQNQLMLKVNQRIQNQQHPQNQTSNLEKSYLLDSSQFLTDISQVMYQVEAPTYIQLYQNKQRVKTPINFVSQQTSQRAYNQSPPRSKNDSILQQQFTTKHTQMPFEFVQNIPKLNLAQRKTTFGTIPTTSNIQQSNNATLYTSMNQGSYRK